MGLSNQTLPGGADARAAMAAADGALDTAAAAPGSAAIDDLAAGFLDASAWRRLSNASSLADFAEAWLNLQCETIGVVHAAVVVLADDQGGFAPIAHWPPGAQPSAAAMSVSELVLAQGQGAVRRANRNAPAPGATAAIAYPLGDVAAPAGARGVVAMDVEHHTDARLGKIMRTLQWGCAWWQARLQDPVHGPPELTTVLELVATALDAERFLGAATAAVTQMAVTFGCDRVAYASRAGRHCRVRAISHTATFSKKSSLTRLLGEVMDEALDQGESIVVPPPAGSVPLVTRKHEALREARGGGTVCTVPLGAHGQVVGALTLERGGDARFERDELALFGHIAILLGPLLETRRREDRWIGIKIADSARRQARAMVGPRHFTLKTVCLSVLAIAAYLALATGEYRVNAPASVEGAVQRAVIASQDGYIAQATVRAGDVVEAGQPLARLQDEDLRLEKLESVGEREKHLREYSRALAAKRYAEVRILRAQLDQAEARINLLAEQIARTRVTAPFAGIVVSGDLSQSLGAPVSRGDVLFEVAPLDSYRVILKVDERDVSQLAEGQRGQIALAGLPGEPMTIEVARITPVSFIEQGRNVFRVEATLVGDVSALRPGMQGVAKVHVDERKRVWIWTHKLGYFLRLWLWSWWP